eukprot:1954098-Rhodomonas_salina.4
MMVMPVMSRARSARGCRDGSARGCQEQDQLEDVGMEMRSRAYLAGREDAVVGVAEEATPPRQKRKVP